MWLNDGSCGRLRAERPNQAWAYDFVQDRTRDGKVLRMLVVVDEFSRECLAIQVARGLTSDDVLAVLAELFVEKGVPPEHIRSGNGPEFVAAAVRGWLARLGVGTLFIEPGSPGENGYCESFNGKLRDELLDREVFHSLREAQVLIGARRSLGRAAALQRPPSALGARLPTTGARGGAVAGVAVTPPDRWRPRRCRVSLTLRLDRLGGAGHSSICSSCPPCICVSPRLLRVAARNQ